MYHISIKITGLKRQVVAPMDGNAKAEIYEIMDRIAGQGVAIMMISSELIGMSDRIYVMKKGSISLEIEEKAQMTPECIRVSTL